MKAAAKRGPQSPLVPKAATNRRSPTAARKAQDLARKLAETARGGDAKATLAAFGALGKEGCGGCHETFRKKQD